MPGPFLRSLSPGNLFRTLLLAVFAAAAILFFGDILLDALGVLFGGCLLAFLLTPLSRLLEKKLGRSISALLSIFLLAVVLLLALGFLLPMLAREAGVLVERLPAAFERLRSLGGSLLDRIRSLLPGLLPPASGLGGADSGLGELARGTFDTISGFAGGVYRFALSVVLGYFLMADRERILLRCELMIPSPHRKSAVQLGNTLLRELRLYLRGQATIALAVGILSAAALGLIGVRSGILLGLIVGVFNMIPYFGPILGSIPAVLLALSDGWQKAACAIIAMFLVQQIDGLVISPRIMGNITGFSPAVVLLALFIGSGAGGIIGLLIAMPALMCLRTIYRVFVQRYENN